MLLYLSNSYLNIYKLLYSSIFRLEIFRSELIIQIYFIKIEILKFKKTKYFYINRNKNKLEFFYFNISKLIRLLN